MMITTEQASLAAHATRVASTKVGHPPVSDEILRAAYARVASTPDLREDRVAAAREHLASGVPDCRELAEMILGRMVSDRLG